MAEQPTQEQIRELWEWCGLKYVDCFLDEKGNWHYPNGRIKNFEIAHYPPLDLNNLFKFAVPKAIDEIMAEQECSSDVAYGILFKRWLQELELNMTRPALTLFWAIYKAFGG